MMSYFCGRWTIWSEALSTMKSLNWMNGESCAISRAVSRNRPSDLFMMFALWTQVTALRPYRLA